MPAGSSYHFAISIGAGLEVTNAGGSILGSYTPQASDVTAPLGSVDSRQRAPPALGESPRRAP